MELLASPAPLALIPKEVPANLAEISVPTVVPLLVFVLAVSLVPNWFRAPVHPVPFLHTTRPDKALA